MTLTELYENLAPSFPLRTQQNMKTAIRHLAAALQCADPQHCALDQFNRPLPSLSRLLETHLSTHGRPRKGNTSHLIRNTKNNISRLFRCAEEQHLFSLIPVTITPRYDSYRRPPRLATPVSKTNGTFLVYAQWPPTLQDAFTALTTWAMNPVVPGRPAALRKRFSTLEDYRLAFEGYFGFLHHIQHCSTLTFDHLFDIILLTSYVHWHVNDYHHRPTFFIKNFLTIMIALTRQYRPTPELHTQLRALQKTIPKPAPLYNKEEAWVSLETLRAIGHTLWPHKQPKDFPQDHKSPGLLSAVHASVSLMLRLWTYIPYRQRNIREMQLGTNLRKDAQGHWRLTFRGEQLKVAVKRGQPNIFDLPFPKTLVPVLEDYLTIWRPLLLAKSSDPSSHVFLTQYGRPYKDRHRLRDTTQAIVYRYTGKYWHPHIIRTVWATEWIRNGGDFYKAAYMLNDKLETIIARYAHLREENVAEEVYEALDKGYTS